MAKESPATGGSFDLDKVQKLIRMMEKHDLREVKLSNETEKWVLKRGAEPVASTVAISPAVAPQPVPATSPQGTPEGAAETAPAGDGLLEIKSPTVGTFYSAAAPEDPPFIKNGDSVTPDKVVCIVEAMKVFNDIHAEVSGTIVECLVNNGDPVEYGQALFRVRP